MFMSFLHRVCFNHLISYIYKCFMKAISNYFFQYVRQKTEIGDRTINVYVIFTHKMIYKSLFGIPWYNLRPALSGLYL